MTLIISKAPMVLNISRSFATQVERFRFALGLCWVVCWLGASELHAGQLIVVPTDQPTIQDGIQVALPGDTVEVLAGTYVENIDFQGKDILLRSRDGAATTTIQAAGPGPVVRFTNGEDRAAQIQGFTLTGGTAAGAEGGIFCAASSPTITQCILTDNSGSLFAGGFVCLFGAPLLVGTEIHNNTGSGAASGGAYCRGGAAVMVDCTVRDNSAADLGAGGMAVSNGAVLEWNRVSLTGNTAVDGFGGGLRVWDSQLLTTDCEVRLNHAMASPGGGISIARGQWTSTGDTIESNTATFGGGLFSINSSLNSADLTLSSNTAQHDGGGAHLVSAEEEVSSLGSIVFGPNCAISLNESTEGNGGGLSLDQATVSVIDSQLTSNTCASGRGGGVSVIGGTLDLDNALLTGNTAETGGAIAARLSVLTLLNSDLQSNVSAGGGGGAVALEESTGVIDGCDFLDNENDAFGGGGVYTVNTPTVVTNCLFERNTSFASGGGLFAKLDLSLEGESLDLDLRDCDFRENVTVLGRGGGVYVESIQSARLERCLFDLNDCPSIDGGGLYTRSTTLDILDCQFTDNNLCGAAFTAGSVVNLQGSSFEANVGISGGGLQSSGSNVNIIHCQFQQNEALNFGGAMSLLLTEATIINCQVVANFTQEIDGGGIYCNSCDAQIIHCTIIRNEAGRVSNFGAGGGLFTDDSLGAGAGDQVEVNSSILFANEARFGDDIRDQDDVLTVSYSNVGGGFAGIGNLDGSPGLSSDGIHLRPNSPCINAGDPDLPQLTDSDLDGDPRVVFGRVDIGADEFFELIRPRNQSSF